MQIVHTARLAVLPGDRHRDRMAIRGANQVRPLIRHKAAIAREQMKFDAARRKALVISEVAMPGHRAFDFVVGDDGAAWSNSARTRTESPGPVRSRRRACC